MLEGVGERVKSTDFRSAQAAGDATLSRPGFIAGTPASSPEVPAWLEALVAGPHAKGRADRPQ